VNQYHKIHTLFKRDPKGKVLWDQFADPAFEYLKENKWSFTEKVDGTNIRIMRPAGATSFQFGGKTDRALLPAQLVEHLRETFPDSRMPEFEKHFPDGDICLYGEGYGAKIQKVGGLYSPTQKFVLFDVSVSHWWLRREDVENVAEKLSLDVVPVVGGGTLSDLVEKCRKGFDSAWGPFPAEGLVARPAVELKLRNGQRIITKMKAVDFA